MSIIDKVIDYVMCWLDADTQVPPYEDYDFLRESRISLDEALASFDPRLDDDIVKTARLLRTQEKITKPLKTRAKYGSFDDGQRAVEELKSFEKQEVKTRQKLFKLLGLQDEPKKKQELTLFELPTRTRQIASRHHSPRRPVPSHPLPGADEEVWALESSTI